QLKPAAGEAAEPALDRDFPVRMLPEEAADNRDPDRLAGLRRRRQFRRPEARSHDAADHGAVDRLEIAIILTLIGQVERLVRTDRVGAVAGRRAALDLVAQCVQAGRVVGAPRRDLRLILIKYRQTRDASGELGLQE